MKSFVTFLTFVSLLSLISAAAIPIGTQYVANSVPAYTNTASIQAFILSTATGTVVQNVTATSITGIDPANSRFVSNIGPLGIQWTFANGSYEYIFDQVNSVWLCFYDPVATYAMEKYRKSFAIKVDGRGASSSVYAGLVGDAGAGNTSVAFTVTNDDITGLPRSFTFSQPVQRPRNPDGSCPPAQAYVTAVVDLGFIRNEVPPAALFTLPPECESPLSWQGIFCF